jgi:peroxiredoxin
MAQLGQRETDLVAAGAAVFALSDEDAPALQQMRDRNKVGFITFLSDKSGEAARKYAGTYPGKTTLKPATFVVDKGKKIILSYLNEDYRTRAATDAVVEAVRKASR